MSSSKPSEKKYANANLNSTLAKPVGPSSSIPVTKAGLLVLSKVSSAVQPAGLVRCGCAGSTNCSLAAHTKAQPDRASVHAPQRPRTAAGPKLSIPKPVNLPSIKKVRAQQSACRTARSRYQRPCRPVGLRRRTRAMTPPRSWCHRAADRAAGSGMTAPALPRHLWSRPGPQ